MKRLFILALFLLPAYVILTPALVFAQVIVSPTAPPSITEAFVVVTIVGFVVGFLAQGLKTGNLFGILFVPQKWAPYLGVVLTFLTGAEQGLSASTTLTGAVWLNVVFLGFQALMTQGGAAALHTHTKKADEDSGPPSSDAAKAPPLPRPINPAS